MCQKRNFKNEENEIAKQKKNTEKLTKEGCGKREGGNAIPTSWKCVPGNGIRNCCENPV